MDTVNKVEQSKKVRNTVGFLLTVVMMGLTIFVLYIQSENYQTIETSSDLSLNAHVRQSDNYRQYVKKYNDTKAQLLDTQTRLSKMTLELELVSKELESTKTALSDTQNMLAQAQEENKVMHGDPQASARLQKLQASANSTNQVASRKLENLQKKNESYNGELAKLQSDLNNYQADVKDLDKGKAMIREFKAKINAVKEKMAALKREAHMAQVAAQAEHDRQLAILGNNGFMFKDGQSKAVAQVQPEKSVDIDVKFVP
jgi:chromosome segregation ATPase